MGGDDPVRKYLTPFLVLIMAMLRLAHAMELRLIYDNDGNLVLGDGKYRKYNSLNQLVKVYNGSDDTEALLQE